MSSRPPKAGKADRMVLSPQEPLTSGGPAEELERRIQEIFKAGFDHVVVAKSYVGCLSAGGGGSDTTPPTASITAPANGATVSGTITVSANASDDVGVAGVQFKQIGRAHV